MEHAPTPETKNQRGESLLRALGRTAIKIIDGFVEMLFPSKPTHKKK